VIGIEPSLWKKLYNGKVPKQLHEFRELTSQTSLHKKTTITDSTRTNVTDNNETKDLLQFPKSGGDLFLYTKGLFFFVKILIILTVHIVFLKSIVDVLCTFRSSC
jgi:hypothetical protein